MKDTTSERMAFHLANGFWHDQDKPHFNTPVTWQSIGRFLQVSPRLLPGSEASQWPREGQETWDRRGIIGSHVWPPSPYCRAAMEPLVHVLVALHRLFRGPFCFIGQSWISALSASALGTCFTPFCAGVGGVPL